MTWEPKGSNANTRKRLAIMARDGERCWICNQPFSKRRPPSLDHMIPKSKGGTNSILNLKLAHSRCNRARGNQDFIGWPMQVAAENPHPYESLSPNPPEREDE